MRRCVSLGHLAGRFARCCRHASTSTKALEAKATFQWAQLTNRALIRLSGVDAAPFLQALITNDMRHFEQYGQTSSYAMMLNNRGRVVNDLILYRFDDPAGTGPNYVLECDATRLKPLTDVLIRYRMRKKVDMVSCVDSLAVFALFHNLSKSVLDSAKDPAGGTALPTLQLMKSSHAPIAWVLDPRVPSFGGRVVIGNDRSEIDAYFSEYQKSSLEQYDEARYLYGICEGAADSPPDKSLPLESNCDYMNGISFHKGCYIGQELTARTHHVGVVRKRLMPVRVDDNKQVLNDVVTDAAVLNETGKSVGKFRCGRGRLGLALLRIEEALASESLHIDCSTVGRIRIHTWKPFWWADGALEGEVRGSHATVKE